MREDDLGTGLTGSNGAIAFTTLLLVVTLVLLASTFGLRASSALVPRVVGIPLVALLCYRLIREMSARGTNSSSARDVQPGPKADEIGAVLWVLALPAAATILGFVAGPALFVFAWARYRAGERVVAAAAAAAITGSAILVVFVRLLGAPLWQGLLGFLV